MGEFTEVGDTIEEFASDNATVVVGTVIDAGMTDDIRVTVVATGLGDATNVRSAEDTKEEYEAIRALHGRQSEAEDKDKVTSAKGTIKLIAPGSTSDDELAELILHLSNVYKSIGGDELVVYEVKDLPPDIKGTLVGTRKKGATG